MIREITLNEEVSSMNRQKKSVSFHTAYIIARTLEIDLDDLVPDEWKE